jgi:hypothetical protein
MKKTGFKSIFSKDTYEVKFPAPIPNRAIVVPFLSLHDSRYIFDNDYRNATLDEIKRTGEKIEILDFLIDDVNKDRARRKNKQIYEKLVKLSGKRLGFFRDPYPAKFPAPQKPIPSSDEDMVSIYEHVLNTSAASELLSFGAYSEYDYTGETWEELWNRHPNGFFIEWLNPPGGKFFGSMNAGKERFDRFRANYLSEGFKMKVQPFLRQA